MQVDTILQTIHILSRSKGFGDLTTHHQKDGERERERERQKEGDYIDIFSPVTHKAKDSLQKKEREGQRVMENEESQIKESEISRKTTN